MSKPTKQDLWQKLADERRSRYPEMSIEDCLFFVAHQYPTRRDAETAAAVLLAPCDRCGGANDRREAGNYCSRCASEYQARIAKDPEQHPCGCTETR